MRQTLNDNPMVQLAVIALVGVVFAVVLFTTVLSSDEEAAPTGPPPLTVGGASGAEAAPATTEPAPATPAPATPEAPAPTTPAPDGSGATTVPADDLVAGKGLPEGVLVALARGRAVALLVYDPKGLSDEKLEGYVKRLDGRGDVAAFEVKAKNIARYARITQGVQVTQVPALVVVQPRDGSDQLLASVSYGFRSPKSVETAVEDALYDGKQRGLAPE